MDISICTLFEGNYHYGVAALTNSLYKCGFRGDIYVGYRGDLPKWASKTTQNEKLQWLNGKTLLVNQGLFLHFLPLVTDYHLTNYKPDFMLQLFEKFQLDSLFYFDPDIMLNVQWYRMIEWLDVGICLCEDINSPYPEYHPRRVYWRRFYNENGQTLTFKDSMYANGGFIGIRRADLHFLEQWKRVQLLMSIRIGGLAKATLNYNSKVHNEFGEFSCFDRTDQDALNITRETSELCCSILGKGAMGFEEYGQTFMYHAIGNPKPWNYKILLLTLMGFKTPSYVKVYWDNCETPIRFEEKKQVLFKRLAIKISIIINRFYSK